MTDPMKRRLNKSEIVSLTPAYAAAADGIYQTNEPDRVVGVVSIALGLLILGPMLAAAVYVTVTNVIPGLRPMTSPAGLLEDVIVLGVWLAIVGALTFGVVMLIKLGKEVNITKLVGVLLIPWSQVRAILVTNVRQVSSPYLMSGSFISQEVGDWHVFTWDGREIVIPNVSDPYNKLNYVKTRFNLQF